MLKKTCWLLILLLPITSFADDSAAVYFAKQAGVIAGAAEACGQPISTMVMRSGEVIDALKTSDQDKTYALAAFTQAQQTANKNIIQSQSLSCPQVINAYNTLPLMQPDYQEKVIAQLKAGAPGTATPAPTMPTTPVGSTVAGSATPSAVLPSQQAAGVTAPTLSNVLPATAPTQNFVSANNPSLYGTPPINPGAVAPTASSSVSTAANPNQMTEMQRLQLAQQLIQATQTLVGNQTQFIPGTGQPTMNNPLYNQQLNEQLNGMGSNNPIFTGAPLPQVGK